VLRVKKAGVCWEMAPEFEPLLDTLLADPGRIIKETPAKLVTRHELRGGVYYIKRYRNAGLLFRSLKFLFKPSHARREWVLAHRIEALGIPVVRHLALGEKRSALGVQESLLITEEFDGEPLCFYAGRAEPAVQTALGHLLRRMHDQGILQFDLYGNILVRPSPLELRRIDIYQAILKPSISDQERLDNLAFLNTEVPLTEHFWKAYGGDAAEAARTHARSLEMRREFYRNRARRCFRRNMDFEPKRVGPLRCWIRRQNQDERLHQVLEQPDRFLEEQARPLKRGRSATVGAANGLVVKRFNLRRASNLIKNCFRYSRARLAFLRAYHLELVGIPTPRGIAAADRRIGPFLIRSYFVMEEIADARDLTQFHGDTRRAALDLGRLLAKLHNEGFSHRDLKETNILFTLENRPVLIDLEGLVFCDRVPTERAAADLARFAKGAIKLAHFSRGDRLAFIRRYCKERKLSPKALQIAYNRVAPQSPPS
jgi:tRNA A-37 threonylcarbamoyl transferase component Bud32